MFISLNPPEDPAPKLQYQNRTLKLQKSKPSPSSTSMSPPTPAPFCPLARRASFWIDLDRLLTCSSPVSLEPATRRTHQNRPEPRTLRTQRTSTAFADASSCLNRERHVRLPPVVSDVPPQGDQQPNREGPRVVGRVSEQIWIRRT